MKALALDLRLDPRLPRVGQIYSALRAAIVDVRLPPRSVLSESTICAQANVSRTPVRESLIRLSQEGLVDVLPQVGSFVAPIRLSKVVEGHFVRQALELAILRRASDHWSADATLRASRILSEQERSLALADDQGFYAEDQSFHEHFADVAGMAGVSRIIADANTHLVRVRRLATPIVGHMAEALAEHKGILDAVSGGDVAMACDLLSRHLHRVFNTVRRLTRTYAEYFEELDSRSIQDAFGEIVTVEEALSRQA